MRDEAAPDPGAEVVVDARGHRCPVPTLKLRRALERAPAGQVVVLLADDPLARLDVPHFAGSAGHDLLAVEEVDGVLQFRLRRGGGVGDADRAAPPDAG